MDTMNKTEQVTTPARIRMFEAHEPDGHVYRIFSDGDSEGFAEGTLFANDFVRVRNALLWLSDKAQKHGLITDKEAASLTS
jgi:hypothetical protein